MTCGLDIFPPWVDTSGLNFPASEGRGERENTDLNILNGRWELNFGHLNCRCQGQKVTAVITLKHMLQYFNLECWRACFWLFMVSIPSMVITGFRAKSKSERPDSRGKPKSVTQRWDTKPPATGEMSPNTLYLGPSATGIQVIWQRKQNVGSNLFWTRDQQKQSFDGWSEDAESCSMFHFCRWFGCTVPTWVRSSKRNRFWDHLPLGNFQPVPSKKYQVVGMQMIIIPSFRTFLVVENRKTHIFEVTKQPPNSSKQPKEPKGSKMKPPGCPKTPGNSWLWVQMAEIYGH